MPSPVAEPIIIHFDFDAFYASVIENEQPYLKTVPLGIQQKGLLATCNYEARRRGVKKLQPIVDAQKQCPDLVVVNGEDLTRFRNASKTIWLFVRDIIWGHLTERLGLDEMFVDVTSMVGFNLENPTAAPKAPGASFFRLSRSDPAAGFAFAWDQIPGHVRHPAAAKPCALTSTLHKQLLLAAHLANYIRSQIREKFNYCCSAGISTTKVAAKLVGNVNKPDSQTVLLPEAFREFVDEHEVSKIPGIGGKTAHVLRNAVTGIPRDSAPSEYELLHGNIPDKINVEAARNILTPPKIESLLGTASNSNTGRRIWNLLHGLDDTPLTATPLYPVQISIENTFRPNTVTSLAEVALVLKRLLAKLVGRMRTDLLVYVPDANRSTWMVSPRSLRVSVRFHHQNPAQQTHHFSRSAKSAAFPKYTFSLTSAPEKVAQRLVDDVALGLFRRLCMRKHWDLQLLNVAAVNMVGEGSEKKGGDIRDLFATSPRPPEIADQAQNLGIKEGDIATKGEGGEEDDEYDESDIDEDDVNAGRIVCPECGVKVPMFAVEAHARFHQNPHPP